MSKEKISELDKLRIDNNYLNKHVKLVLYAVLVVFISLFVFWIFASKTESKSRPIVNDPSGPAPGKNPGLFLSSGQEDNTKTQSGYVSAGLRQPCSFKSDQKGLPNLPSAFELPPCQDGFICTSDVVQGGPICLAGLGEKCNNLLDCTRDADICYENICLRNDDTLNLKCQNNSDCQIDPNSGVRITNHVCVNNICKINMYPYDLGGTVQNDCRQIEDQEIGMASLDMTNFLLGPYTYSEGSSALNITDNNFLLNVDRSLINNSVVQIYHEDNSPNIQTTIKDYTGTSLVLDLQPGQISSMNDNDSYKIIFGNIKASLDTKYNYCFSKLPVGSPSNIKLNGKIPIPCEDNLNSNNDNFCVDISPTAPVNNFCLDNETASYAESENKTVQLNCLYNQAMENKIISNFNYSIDPQNFDPVLSRIGRLKYPVIPRGDLCDYNDLDGCSQPTVCLNETGTENSYCVIPFDSQICNEGECPEGYTCVSENNQKLCKSNVESICLNTSDCVAGSTCGTGRTIQMFDISSAEYKDILPLPAFQQPVVGDVKLRTSQGLSLYKNHGVSGMLPEYIMLWWKRDSTNLANSRYQINNANNSYQRIVNEQLISFSDISNFDIDEDVKDVLLDYHGNPLLIYQREIDSLRHRAYLANIFANGNINTNNVTSLQSGSKVFVTNIDGSYNDVNKDGNRFEIRSEGTGFALYNINSDSPLSQSEIQSYLSDSGAIQILIHTYSNVYNIDYIPEYTSNSVQNLVLSGNYQREPSGKLYYTDHFKSGDRVTISGGHLVIESKYTQDSDIRYKDFYNDICYIQSCGYAYDSTFTNSDTLPNYTTPLIPNNIESNSNLRQFYYNIASDYYTAVGAAPIITHTVGTTTKFFNQQVSQESSPGCSLILYDKMINYQISRIDTSSTFTVKPVDDFLFQGQKSQIGAGGYIYTNGLNKSFSYNFENDGSSVKFNTLHIDNQDYLIINKEIIHSNLDANISANSQGVCLPKTLNLVQKISYSLSDSVSQDSDIVSYHDGSCYFNFKYLNNSLIPYNNKFNISRDPPYNNNVNSVQSLYDIEDFDSSVRFETLTTYFNNNVNQDAPDLAVDTTFYKGGYDTTSKVNVSLNMQPIFSFDSKQLQKATIETNNLYIDMHGDINDSLNSTSGNYYYLEEPRIIFRDEKDIDLILNNASSEIVIKFLLGFDDPTEGYNKFTGNLGNKQVTEYVTIREANFVIIDILNYDVSIDSSILEVTTNVPFKRDFLPIFNNSIKPRFDSAKIKPRFYIRNIVPVLAYKPIIIPGTTNLIEVYDGSILFTSCKDKDFFTSTEGQEFGRTGYNKIIYSQNGTAVTSFASNNKNNLSMYNLYDGYSYKWQDAGDQEYDGVEDYPGYTETTCVLSKGIQFPYGGTNSVNVLSDTAMALPLQAQYTPFTNAGGDTTFNAINFQFIPNSSPTKFLALADTTYNNPRVRYGQGNLFNYFYNFPNSYNYTNPNYANSTTQMGNFNNLFPVVFDPNKNNSFITDPDSPSQNVRARNIYNAILNINSNYFFNITNYLGVTTKNGITRFFPLYTANNLFASSLNFNDSYLANSANLQLQKDYIISNLFYSADGNTTTYKIKGEIELNLDSFVKYVNNNPIMNNGSDSNLTFLRWPEWFLERFTKNPNARPEIKHIFYSVQNGKLIYKQFYAIIKYNEQNQLVFFDETQQVDDQGVPYSVSLMNLNDQQLQTFVNKTKEIAFFPEKDTSIIETNLLTIVKKCNR